MKKLFLLPVMMFALVGCNKPAPAVIPDPIQITSANLLTYDGTADVAYNSTESEAAVGGITFGYIQLGAYRSESGAIRMRVKDGVGSYLYNKTQFGGKIASIKFVMNESKQVFDNADVWSFKFGTSAESLGNEIKLSTVADTKEYTVTPTVDATFFKVEKIIQSYTFYIDSITISFK